MSGLKGDDHAIIDINHMIYTAICEGIMANLLVRNVDEKIVLALKAQAGAHGVSAEAEHRQILQQALMRPRARSLAQVLAAIPDAGLDEDFVRAGNTRGRDVDVSD